MSEPSDPLLPVQTERPALPGRAFSKGVEQVSTQWCGSQYETTFRARHANPERGMEVNEMAKNSKQTSPRAASAASRTLASRSASKAAKTAAASALAQTPRRGR